MGLGDSEGNGERGAERGGARKAGWNERARAKASKDMCHGTRKEEKRSIREGVIPYSAPSLIYCLLRNMAVTSLLRINPLLPFISSVRQSRL